jgi:hypothetical protein
LRDDGLRPFAELGRALLVAGCRGDVVQRYIDPPRDGCEAELLCLVTTFEEHPFRFVGPAERGQRAAFEQECVGVVGADLERTKPSQDVIGDLNRLRVVATDRRDPSPLDLRVGGSGEREEAGQPPGCAFLDRGFGLVEPTSEERDLGHRGHHERDCQRVHLLGDREPLRGELGAALDLPKVREERTFVGTRGGLRDHEPGHLGRFDALPHLREGAPVVPLGRVDVIAVEQAV